MAFEGVEGLPTASVPDANEAVVSRHGQVAAIRTVGHAADEDGAPAGRLLLQGMQLLARVGVPDLERPVIAGRGELPAVRAKGHAGDRGRVLEGSRLAVVALPLEEVPLPAAQVLGAVVEQFLGAADVA